jgi:hypothetical protein
VQELGAIPAQVQCCLVCDLATVGEDELVDKVTVFGEGPVNNNNNNDITNNNIVVMIGGEATI